MSKNQFAVAWWPLAKILPYKGNPRVISEAAVEKVAASIKAFGWRQPIVVDPAGVIVVGHTRFLAAKQLRLRKAPVHVARGLSRNDLRAYRLADNRTNEEAEWDLGVLASELGDLGSDHFDLALTGFDPVEINDALIASGLAPDPDAAPPAPAAPKSKVGDLWSLGEHRLLCGDATSSADVERLLAGETPHLMVTDPPYGVDYDPAWRLRAGVGSKGNAVGTVANDDRADWNDAWRLFPGTVAYVWHGALFGAVVQESLAKRGMRVRSQIVWIKTRPVLSRGHYHWQHETAFYAVSEGADERWGFVEEHELATYAVLDGSNAAWRGDRRQSTVWFIEHLKNDTGHGTQKPVACMRKPIANNSAIGDAVYDPFCGSGTTIIAAEIEGRRCLAMELLPAYVDVAVSRWETFTGKRATRAKP